MTTLDEPPSHLRREELLKNYAAARYHLARQRRRGGSLTTQFWARQVRQFEVVIASAADPDP